MLRPASVAAAVCLAALSALPSSAREQPPSAPLVRSIQISGAREIADPALRSEIGVREGEALPQPAEDISRTLERFYHEQGYTFARVTASFDEASGRLDVSVDEGVIGGVEFHGVDEDLAQTFAAEFALRAGDVFNRSRARQALDVLLQQTRGAVRPARLSQLGVESSGDLSIRRGSFDLVDRDGTRILLIGLREPAARFKLLPDLGEREDWFTPVDGFVPSVGIGLAIFDHTSFNHAFLAAHLSYKVASQRAGYAVGVDRPLFGRPTVYVGAELHDLTATDDRWQASSLEASLDTVTVRRTFRDYYRRRGVQLNAAVRVDPHVEALVAWRSEQHDQLSTATDFSVWRDDQPFRGNVAIAEGRLNAMIVGASASGRGFDRESLEATYRRHQLEEPFGEAAGPLDAGAAPAPLWRVDWSSELSYPGAFASDFDFRRHIVTARARMPAGEYQTVAARAIAGWSGGVLPPQRLFSVGGIGSVHGYDFKAQTGNELALINLEYEIGWRSGLKAVGFFDAGRAQGPVATTPWLKGVGWGIGVSDLRVDFGYRLNDVPGSLQVLVRFGRSF